VLCVGVVLGDDVEEVLVGLVVDDELVLDELV